MGNTAGLAVLLISRAESASADSVPREIPEGSRFAAVPPASTAYDLDVAEPVSIGEPTLVVDARNVMRSRWPNLTEDRVIDLTRAWANREGVGAALIVFDGTTTRFGGGVSTLDARTRVVGTRGSADDWIAEQAEHLASEGGRVWLVSSDRGLRQRVAPFVERTIGGGSFAGKLLALNRELSD
jgi:hypothetical protein